MQFLALFILIGVTQRGDSTDSNTLSPDNFIDLGIPNCREYVTNYKLSVQTAYLTSVECMLSSSIYIESGFSSIDTPSNSAAKNGMIEVKTGIEGFKDTVSGLQTTDFEKNAKETIEAVEYMTVKYYKKTDVVVTKSETTLSTVTDVKQAQSLLTVKRCKSAYTKFEKDVTAIQNKYDSGSNNNPWDYKSKQYYEAREEVVNLPGVYSSIRDAFLLGNGISMCEGNAKDDQSQLDIYKTEDLSSYFGIKDNDALTLLSQTATSSYKIYKASLTKIYLKSVIHSDSDLAMRITEWEQLNLVRANFEFKSQRIEKFIIDVKKNAEDSFGLDSEDYKTIICTLYTSVNKMLLTVLKSTEVTYTRVMNFNIDRSMMKTDNNKLKVNVINEFYAKILFSNNDASRYDIRVIRKEDSPLPTKEKCIPQNMYPLVINTLIFQTFITEIKFLYIRLQSIKITEKTVHSWILENISLVELQNSIIFSKCSASANKIFILNTATFTYISMQTDQNIQSTDVQLIIDQVSNDVIGKLSINALDVTDTFDSVNMYIEQNIQPQTKPVAYKPRAIEYNKGGNGNSGTPSPSGGTGSPPPSGGTGSPPPSGGTGSPPSSGGTGSPPSSGGTGSPPPSGGTGSPPPSGGTGSPPPSGGTGSPSPSGGTGSPPPSGGTGSPPPSGGTGSPPPSGGTGSPPPSGGTGSPPSSGGTGSPSPSGGTGSPPPSGGTGSPPTSGGNGSPPPEGSSYPPTSLPAGGNSANGDNSINNPTTGYSITDYKYTYITTGVQITESVKYYNESFATVITNTVNYVKSSPETEYTKMLLLSLEFTQKIFQLTVNYLESVASDSIQYITQVTCADSVDFRNALKSIFRDTTEKTGILWSTTEISLKRVKNYPLTCSEYVAVDYSIGYTEYVQNVYKYFEVTYVEVKNQNNDADLFLTSSLEKFTQVYNEVYKAVEQTPDDSYRTFLLCYLTKTLDAYTKTIECFKKQIVEMQQFISKSQNSMVGFYNEIVQMVESIDTIYTSVIIKCKAYSSSTTTVTIFESEYDEAIKTTIITSYTETQTTEIQISEG